MTALRPRPLTERILGALPGPGPVWVVIWAAVPWLNAGANLLLDEEDRSAVWGQSHLLIVLSYASVSFAVVVTLWGARRLARSLGSLLAPMSELIEGDVRNAFRELDSVAGPLLATGVVSIVFGLSALIRDGVLAALLRGTTWFVLGIAIITFIWTYGSLLLGLDRLGRRRLRPRPGPVDPGLGLQPLGALAFMGLWMLLVSLVPVVLTGLPDVVGVVLGLLVLVAALSTFFLALFRLHRQMVAVKRQEVELARSLYAQAYEPVERERTAQALERQHHLLQAADGLERRAREIHEWPVDEGIITRVATISTSVLAITVARLILDPVGL